MENLPHVVPINKQRTEALLYGQQLLVNRYRLWRQAVTGRRQAANASPDENLFIKIPGNEESGDEDSYMRIESFLRIMDRSVVEAQMFMRREPVKEMWGDKEREVSREDPIGTEWSDAILDALSEEPEPTDSDLVIGPYPTPEWLHKIVPVTMQDKLRRIHILALWLELLDKKFVAAQRNQEFSIITLIEEEKGRPRRKAIHIRYNEQTLTVLSACIFSTLYEVMEEDVSKLPQALWEIQQIKENVAEIPSGDLQKLIPENYIIELPNIVDLRFK